MRIGRGPNSASARRSPSGISSRPSPPRRASGAVTTRPRLGSSYLRPGGRTRRYASTAPPGAAGHRCHDDRSSPSRSRYGQSCSTTNTRARTTSSSYSSSFPSSAQFLKHQVVVAIRRCYIRDMERDDVLDGWLRGFLDRHGAVSGTVHVVDGDLLRLAAAVNIPPPVQEVTAE